MDMLSRIMWKVSRRKRGLSESLYHLARRYVVYYTDFGYDYTLNGERRVLELLAENSMSVVLDVGANKGNWAVQAAHFFPKAVIHCFELSPSTFTILNEKLSGDRFVTNSFGLSDRAGPIEFKDYGPDYSFLNAFMSSSFHDAKPYETRKAQVLTGDEYLERSRIETIDFLKIDVEGSEYQVLQGFKRSLEQQKIRVIQFEYGYANGDAHSLMRDFWHLLANHGYRVGKIWSNGVDFSEFNYEMNNFESGPNYLAVRMVDQTLVDLLQLR